MTWACSLQTSASMSSGLLRYLLALDFQKSISSFNLLICGEVFLILCQFSLHDMSTILHANLTPFWVINDPEDRIPYPCVIIMSPPLLYLHGRTLATFSLSRQASSFLGQPEWPSPSPSLWGLPLMCCMCGVFAGVGVVVVQTKKPIKFCSNSATCYGLAIADPTAYFDASIMHVLHDVVVTLFGRSCHSSTSISVK